jgi:hypothetical protein
MKKWLENNIGKSWKTTLVGYVSAGFVAVYPLLDADVDWNSKTSVKRYFVKLLIAAGIALMGKFSADSAQVKQVDQKVDEHINE